MRIWPAGNRWKARKRDGRGLRPGRPANPSHATLSLMVQGQGMGQPDLREEVTASNTTHTTTQGNAPMTPATANPPAIVAPAPGTVAVYLKINGELYAARCMRRTPAGKAFRLRKPDGESYDIHPDAHGLECTRWDWIARWANRESEGCKHCRAAEGCRATGLTASIDDFHNHSHTTKRVSYADDDIFAAQCFATCSTIPALPRLPGSGSLPKKTPNNESCSSPSNSRRTLRQSSAAGRNAGIWTPNFRTDG